MAKKKGAITTQRGKGQVVWEFRGQGEEGLCKQTRAIGSQNSDSQPEEEAELEESTN